MIGSIIGWVVAGLIVGGLARLLVPGRQHMGIGMTIVLGIVGALVGGFLANLFFGPPVNTGDMYAYDVSTAWPGWIMAVIGGVIVLWIAIAASGSRTIEHR